QEIPVAGATLVHIISNDLASIINSVRVRPLHPGGVEVNSCEDSVGEEKTVARPIGKSVQPDYFTSVVDTRRSGIQAARIHQYRIGIPTQNEPNLRPAEECSADKLTGVVQALGTGPRRSRVRDCPKRA